MNILGISSFCHDPSACLVRDGRVAAAAEEKKVTRLASTDVFPLNAVNYCVQAGGITFADIDLIVFHEKPFLRFSRVVAAHLRAYPFSMVSFMRAMPEWMGERLSLPMVLEKEIGYMGRTGYMKHHLSHAASFLVSPFEEAAIMTCGKGGEYATATVGAGRGKTIEIFNEMTYPDSLGLVFSAVGEYLGLGPDGEGLADMAGGGEPSFSDKFLEIIKVARDGSFSLDESYFRLDDGSGRCGRKFMKTFGPPRLPGSGMEKRYYDMAATLQKLSGDVLVATALGLHEKIRSRCLCLAGELFINSALNARILAETPFEKIFTQSAPGDGGAALGAAVYAGCGILGKGREWVMDDAGLGPEYPDHRIRRAIISEGFSVRRVEDDGLSSEIAGLIANDRTVGWFRGKAEFGPRALGNRCILANPCRAAIKNGLNEKVKKREPFLRPGAAVLEEKCGEYFDLSIPSPFMLLAPRVLAGKEEAIPVVVNDDGTADVHTVRKEANPVYWDLINKFSGMTGVPMLAVTSLGMRHALPIVSPEDAAGFFRQSGLDSMVIGNYIIGSAA